VEVRAVWYNNNMATITKLNGNTRVRFSYTAPSAKINSVLEDASRYLWREVTDDQGVVTNPFADATNQEKLDVVDAHVKTVILNLARTYRSREDQKVARELAENNAKTNYDLG